LGLPRRNVAGIEVAIENAVRDSRVAPFSAFAETSRDDSDADRRLVTWLLSSNSPYRAYKNYCGGMNLLEHVWRVVIQPARDQSRQAAAIIGNPI